MARIQARFASKCSCGARFPERTVIEYRSGKVIGCEFCKFTGIEPSRVAGDAVELWALVAIVALSQLCDGARSLDGQGFSKQDSAAGKSLARGILAQPTIHPSEVKLTAAQWRFALRMGAKYHRQVGGADDYSAPAMQRAAKRLGMAVILAPAPEAQPVITDPDATPMATLLAQAGEAFRASVITTPDPSADTVAALALLAEIEAERAAIYAALPR